MVRSFVYCGMVVGYLAAQVLLTGCTTSHLHSPPDESKRLDTRVGIAILLARFAGKSGEAFIQAEQEIVTCVSEALHTTNPTLAIVPPDRFRRTAFPDLTPEATPSSAESFAALLPHPEFRRRIASLGIRYLILVNGGTTQAVNPGVSVCGGYPAFACFVLVTMDRETRLNAAIFDLQAAGPPNDVRVSASGTPWFALVGVLPLGLPARTEASACADLGAAVANLFQGKDPPVGEANQGPPAQGKEAPQ